MLQLISGLFLYLNENRQATLVSVVVNLFSDVVLKKMAKGKKGAS